MNHFIRIISKRSSLVYALIKQNYKESHSGIGFDNIQLFLRCDRTKLVTAINVLLRHRFIEQDHRDFFKPVDRVPLLMPFCGVVKWVGKEGSISQN